MAQKPHRANRVYRGRPRKFTGKCEECGKSLCICQAVQYTDEANAAIANNSPWLCRDCYGKQYGELMTPVRVYIRNLWDRVEGMLSRHDLPEDKRLALILLLRLLGEEDKKQVQEEAMPNAD